MPSWASVLIALAVVLAINLMSARAFGEFEFWASMLKVGAIVIFLAVGLVVVIGRAHIGDHRAGFNNLWSHPGGFWPAPGASGVPWAGIVMTSVVYVFGAILNAVDPEAFETALEAAALGVIFTWGTIFVCQLRLRKLVEREIIPKSYFQMPGSPYTNHRHVHFRLAEPT